MTVLKTYGAVRFRYHGIMREVDNIDFDEHLLVGFEMRKGGKFSYKIKKFEIAKIEGDIIAMPLPKRVGPKIGRP